MNDLTTIKDEIENDYKFYCKNISKYGHPMSLESIYWIIDFLKLKILLHKSSSEKYKKKFSSK